MNPDEAIGRRVIAARAKIGITREELAERIGTPKLGYQTIGKIERGERRLERHEAPLFARALGVTPDDFYAAGPEQNGSGTAAPVDLGGIEAQLAGINNKLAGMEAVRHEAFTDLYARVQRNERMLEEVLSLLRSARDEAAASGPREQELIGPPPERARELLGDPPNDSKRDQEAS